MHIISEQYPEVETTIYTADLVEGQTLAAELYTDGYDAIISRGGTAKLIRQVYCRFLCRSSMSHCPFMMY